MKILLATGIFPPEIGGPATYAKLLADELPKRGISVDVLPFREVRKYPKIIRHIVYFYKVISRSQGCDLVFTQDPISTGLPVICASFFSHKKVVMRVAGDYAWEQSTQRFDVSESIDDFQNKKYGWQVELLRSIQRFTTNHANVIITPSDYFNRLVSGWLQGNKSVRTIYNGIDLTIPFDRGNTFKTKTIMTAGRLVPWKGFDTLIEALNDMPEWELQIAGDGPDKERLLKLIDGYGLNDRVHLLGNVPRNELLGRISRAHIFALLSTFESFSFQVVEAMHAGAPVIAADIGNLREIITDGKDGILIPANNPQAFMDAVKKISENKMLADDLIKNAATKAQQFSIQKTVDAVTLIFKSL